MNSRLATSLLLVMVVAVAGALWAVFRGSDHTVVVYVSEDQVFSEPILRDFERETGIKVKAVYDTEETKSAGAMNRLIAEKANPQADVYWANEPIRAEVLRQREVSVPYRSLSAQGIPDQFRNADGHWTGFSARGRILIVNRSLKEKPLSIQAYTDPRFKGKAVIANPLFGTTTAHIAALFVVWGDPGAKTFLDAIRKNDIKVSSSNGESADQVAIGKFEFAVADTDDVHSRLKQGQPVEAVYPDQEEGGLGCFIIPNAVLLIKGGPHPEEGKRLIDYLLSRETEKKLAYSDAGQIPLRADVDTPSDVRRLETLKVMKVDYAVVAEKMQMIQPLLRDWVGH